MSNFYVIFDSQHSKDYFPDNNGQHFKLKLNPPLSLTGGSWTVALVDFFPKKPKAQYKVYMSGVQASVVGDRQEPLLRAFPTTPHHLMYIPLQQHQFDCLDIYIKGDTATQTSFSKGVTKCTLHFKQA